MKKPKIIKIANKILHLQNKINTPTVEEHSLNNRMDYYFRKALKENAVPYYYSRKDKVLIINSAQVGLFLNLRFEEDGYIIARQLENYAVTWLLKALDIEELWNKLFQKKVIRQHEYKKLTIPQHLVAMQRRSNPVQS